MPRTLPSAQETVRILAGRRTRPMPGPPPGAGRALVKTIKALEGRFGHGADALQARWREIVGEDLARRTEPSKLIKSRTGDGSTLELRVEGPSAAIIQHRGPDILDRVNLFLGAGAVSRLRIVQGPLRGRVRRGGPAPARARRRPTGPIDAAAERALAADLEGFADGPLKAALTRLGREIMRDAAKNA
ncbi:MAG: hypothetical protein JWO83_4158 [Caulobacteraceae bacterium]|jgi:hypothetical protein|nr:hypothetical protein [Caulobacteraceae bacterium]